MLSLRSTRNLWCVLLSVRFTLVTKGGHVYGTELSRLASEFYVVLDFDEVTWEAFGFSFFLWTTSDELLLAWLWPFDYLVSSFVFGCCCSSAAFVLVSYFLSLTFGWGSSFVDAFLSAVAFYCSFFSFSSRSFYSCCYSYMAFLIYLRFFFLLAFFAGWGCCDCCGAVLVPAGALVVSVTWLEPASTATYWRLLTTLIGVACAAVFALAAGV